MAKNNGQTLRATDKGQTLRVTEIFLSIQGESSHMGDLARLCV